ncbi:hypothetical protein M758_8G134300 [Ceratodon purpureus]|nr:hypothetical protein M758_8G134300 [Ceratodon purpureus]KAG0608808.1 hypothetical protein M758_8G134300 [Ceratodon purpureus]
MAVERSDYEESRKQRVEENKRRMQELGIMELSKDLKGSKQKNVVRKPLKRKIDDAGGESRRSSRVAAKPAVTYKDQLDLLPGMRARCGTRERVGLGRRYVSDLSRRAAYEAAEEAFKDIRNPGFVKAMLHSHVTSCFWLGLPNRFCQEHMPLEETTFILEDDKGKEWECVYLAHKTGMSGGWRGFSLDHELVDGDSCIFELVSPLRFKVHFFRCDEEDGGPEEVDDKKTGVNVAGKDTKTEKKVGKVATKKKKAGFYKGKKSRKSSSKKLKLEDGEEDNEDSDDDDDDEGDDYAPRASKQDADTNVAGPSRASRRQVVKKEADAGEGLVVASKNKDKESGKLNGKELDDLIELESGEDEDEDKDALKSPLVTKTIQGGSGSLSSGRATRNSLRRSLN